jgi:DnaK suppressor protein
MTDERDDKYLFEGGKIIGKRCAKCQKMLPPEQFSLKFKGSSRLKSRCKACVRARSQEHYRKHVEDYVQRSAARKSANRSRAKQVRDAFLSGKHCEVCGCTDSICVYAHQGQGKRFHELVRDPPVNLTVEDLEHVATGARFFCKSCLGAVVGIISKHGSDLLDAIAAARLRMFGERNLVVKNMSEKKKTSITFRASPIFWEALDKKDLNKRRRLLRDLIRRWDGTMRDVPDEWRGLQELSLPADARLTKWAQQLKENGLTRTNAVFSAALQAGIVPPAKKGEGVATLDEEGGKMADSAKDDGKKAKSTKEGGKKAASTKEDVKKVEPRKPNRKSSPSDAHDEVVVSLPDGATTFYKLRDMPYSLKQSQQLLHAVLAMRTEAIASLRARGAWVMDASGHGDEADIALSRQERADQEAALARARRMLVDADAALARMRAGEYGWCEETGEVIEFERMKANPLARLSTEAQEKLEKLERMRGLAS